MKTNMGIIDRIIRTVAAIIIGALYYTGIISGVGGTILLVVACVFVATSLVSFCPLYTIFGFSTRPTKQA